MLNELEKLKSICDYIGDIRGKGMFLGIEIVKNKKSKVHASEIADYIVAEFKRNYIIMSTEGIYGNILKFKPPMCFSLDNAQHWLNVFKTIIENLNEISTEIDLDKQSEHLQLNQLKAKSESVSSDCQSEDSNDSLENSREELQQEIQKPIPVACS